MEKGKKGNFQYIKEEKKRRVLKTLLLFAIPITAFVAAACYYGTTTNLISVVAIVGCLPACKSLVGLIMVFMYRSINESTYQKIESHKGSLTMAYELVLTNYEKNTFVDAFAICGNQVIGYTSASKVDLKYAEEHTQKILHHNGYKVSVKIFKDFQPFLDRLDSMNLHAEGLRADIPFKPDDRYPDFSREELIKHTILAISL